MTGSNGFVGRYLAKAFRQEHHVIGLDCEMAVAPSEGLEWDLRRGLPEGLPKHIDGIIHCAALFESDKLFSPDDVFRVNVEATRQLLEYALNAGARLFVYMSTGSVYGLRGEICREADSLNPSGIYACSKAAAEALVRAYSSRMRTLSLRLFYPYGPNQRAPRLIPGLVERIIAGERVPLNGPNGSPLVNPLFVEDLVTWVCRLIETNVAGVFNLAGSEIVSIRQLALMLGELLGLSVEFQINPSQAGNLVGDFTRVFDVSGQYPHCSLRQGLAAVVQSGLPCRRSDVSAKC